MYLCNVIEIGRHIEILLLANDCVIVPDFGGFVAHHVSARYDETDHTWLPPMRTLGFNPQLRINDSLLAQSYVEAYDISYPEALRRIEDDVEELKYNLENEGCYTINDVGTLIVNAEGNYQFEPCEAGILSPEFYGLGGCQFLSLKDAKDAPQELSASTVAPESASVVSLPTEQPSLLEFTDEEDDDRAIHIKMSWIRNAIAIAAAVVAFFIMATPIANSDLRTRTMSHLQGNLLYKLIPQDTNMTPATPVAETTVAAQAEKKEASETIQREESKTTKQEVQPTSASALYCIVLASQVKKSNAENYVEQLKKRGYENAEVYIHKDVVRVIYGSYETESEAYRHLNRLNNKEEFYDAWVYKKVES